MNTHNENDLPAEKGITEKSPYGGDLEDPADMSVGGNALHRDLQGRHMQMIAM
jgi:amino acid permease